MEEWPRVADALAWHAEGLGFTDALHGHASHDCDVFHRFAHRIGGTPKVIVPTEIIEPSR